jgi:hypothetical protein
VFLANVLGVRRLLFEFVSAFSQQSASTSSRSKNRGILAIGGFAPV